MGGWGSEAEKKLKQGCWSAGTPRGFGLGSNFLAGAATRNIFEVVFLGGLPP